MRKCLNQSEDHSSNSSQVDYGPPSAPLPKEVDGAVPTSRICTAVLEISQEALAPF